MLDEQEFKIRADRSLEQLYNSLATASDRHAFEADFGGALIIEFEDPPAKFVVSPNSPVRQIWVSAQSQSFKLDWDPDRQTFVLPASGQTLKDLLERAISAQIGEEVTL
ncbi:MAG TPA: iron donor protein CyaY [Bryobacteraceae bacterium]|nr:iron donor protein CyaY [Bryobacteraceae bacterium]